MEMGRTVIAAIIAGPFGKPRLIVSLSLVLSLPPFSWVDPSLSISKTQIKGGYFDIFFT